MQHQYRQGDVFLVRVDGLPAAAKPVKVAGEKIILAHGEATGHHHAVLERDATYKVVRQREYSPEAIRNVAD